MGISLPIPLLIFGCWTWLDYRQRKPVIDSHDADGIALVSETLHGFCNNQCLHALLPSFCGICKRPINCLVLLMGMGCPACPIKAYESRLRALVRVV